MSSRSGSAWFPWSLVSAKKSDQEAAQEIKRQEEILHRKRLAAILRYIASMHQALRAAEGASGHCFVRNCNDAMAAAMASAFFQNEQIQDEFAQLEGGVLFSTNDFRKLIAAEAVDGGSTSLWSSSPFSFYALSSSSAAAAAAESNQRTFARTISSGLYGSSPYQRQQQQRNRGQGLWLRLTRLGPAAVAEQPDITHPVIERYLNGWLKESAPRGVTRVSELLTIHRLDRAPGIPSTVSARNHRLIKSFLKRYKRYLRMRLYQQTLEPIYNRLFAWQQEQHENNEELVWGLGHARFLAPDGRLINGPLLEVLVEVELAPDGALLVRPREHTGVALNREVVSALATADPTSQSAALSQLHRTVGDLESTQFAPGQPATYVSLLKRIANELSAGGAFQPSSVAHFSSKRVSRGNQEALSKLIVTEAWCLYSRSKPSSVWARDANLLADKIVPERISDTLPLATWSLTNGPGKLEQMLEDEEKLSKVEVSHSSEGGGGIAEWLSNNFIAQDNFVQDPIDESIKISKPIFPLATSDSQHRIADLLLKLNYPAVLAEGPPGTGKTHTIANIVCAYLCQGKRVLVTSKNANALNVLRNRMPKSVQELCVDLTMSELQGMRQLQQTVERLAVRVSAASSEIESEKCNLLQRSINDLEHQLEEIDGKLTAQSERVRKLLQQPDGIKMMENACSLVDCAPWLMQILPTWKVEDVESLYKRIQHIHLGKKHAILTVTGFQSPPPKALLSLALAKAGSKMSSLANATRSAVAALPVIGVTMDAQLHQSNEDLEKIQINKKSPESIDDWKLVADALKHYIAVHNFHDQIWRPYVTSKGWPDKNFEDQSDVQEMADLVGTALEVKRLQIALDAQNETMSIAECRKLDEHRTRLTTQRHHHSEELADAAVITELSRSFSPEAQSALIRFSQIAGAAKFSKAAKPSKMTQRQRRRRQEYLNAFDSCCRFIPCWILTTSQISDYLPAECLFDLVVIDESSQSDVTVLPGMMRGKQWLIVGDGKQVSPTESFVSEEDIDNLRATLPPSPLGDALLPGRSFFDMCAQAFPRGRVVLSEHFRCAPEIIDFSNRQFYDGRLIPLRLPTKLERFIPSLIDVKLNNGVKHGKVNEREADKVVEMILETMDMADIDSKPRSIGVISLIGDEQSRLIRGRLLDACGPEKMARHDVLIGDPPTFQGAERDVVFLSMVCSRGSCPTQNQQFHFQRANVALSRARDRMVLVRSINLKDIPSLDDAKVPIIEFFMQANKPVQEGIEANMEESDMTSTRNQRKGVTLLKFLLKERGYRLVDMGVVWKDAVCVEHEKSDTRAAIMVDCEENSAQEWSAGFAQQKAIERVGWKCLRIDALSLVVNYMSAMDKVVRFLSSVGIEEPEAVRDEDESLGRQEFDLEDAGLPAAARNDGNKAQVIEIEDEDEDEDAVPISGEESDRKPAASSPVRPDHTKSSMDFDREENIEASKFGEVVNLDFLLKRLGDDDDGDDDDGEDDDLDLDEDEVFVAQIQTNAASRSPARNRNTNSRPQASTLVQSRKRPPAQLQGNILDIDAKETQNAGRVDESGRKPAAVAGLDTLMDSELIESNNEGGSGGSSGGSSTKRSKRRRLDKYSRDGRWYPGSAANRDGKQNESDVDEWYDTDSDLPKGKKGTMEDDDGSWMEEEENDQEEEDLGVGDEIEEDNEVDEEPPEKDFGMEESEL